MKDYFPVTTWILRRVWGWRFFVLKTIIVFFVLIAPFHVVNIYEVWKAKRLLRQSSAIQLGSDISVPWRKIEDSFDINRSKDDPTTRSASVSFGLSKFMYTHPFFINEMKWIGLHPWLLTTTVETGVDGKATSIYIRLGMRPRIGQDIMTGYVESDGIENKSKLAGYELESGCKSGQWSSHPGYWLHFDPRYFRSFTTHVMPPASSVNYSHAKDIRLSCLVNPLGCAEPAQIMPLAWEDYQSYRATNPEPTNEQAVRAFVRKFPQCVGAFKELQRAD